MDSNESPILGNEEQFARVKEICQPFYVTDEQLLTIKRSLLREIHKGLKVASNQQASTKCWPTYIQEYPCGCEHGAHKYHYEKETHEIPEELYTADVEDFFDFIVAKLKRFVAQHEIGQELLSISLCFPFPLQHTSLKTAVVLSLDKSLNIQNLVGNEVMELVQNAIDRSKDLNVKVETVITNCTAILLANSWNGKHCHIGINIGFGFGSVYTERVSEIEMCSDSITSPQMFVNTEWGDFGAHGDLDDICTTYDLQVDELTTNKGKRKFEKLVSSLYLGELARQIFLQCINEKVLFGGYISETLKQPFSFTSRHVSNMLDEEDTQEFDNMRLQFDKMGISRPEETECSKVHYILQSIAQRSARLVACGIASLTEKIAESHVAVGLGGSFYLSCRWYQNFLAEKLKEVLNKKFTFELMSLENDVSIGSALSAAISKSKEFIYRSEDMAKILEQIDSKKNEKENK